MNIISYHLYILYRTSNTARYSEPSDSVNANATNTNVYKNDRSWMYEGVQERLTQSAAGAEVRGNSYQSGAYQSLGQEEQ